jgi:Fe-S-cluster containining protein
MARDSRIRLCDNGEPAPAGCAILEAEFPYLDETIRLRVAVPDRPATLADVAPLAREICDRFTSAVIRHVEALGRSISCAKGCGVCCTNYLVPMTVPEALRLWEDLASLPAPERGRLEAGFDVAARKLAESGLEQAYGRLDRDDPASIVAQRELAGKWWSENRFPCPMLRDGACGLYASRPMPCREFLVVSPPDECESNRETRVRRPFPMHAVLAAWAAELEAARQALVLMCNLTGWCRANAARAGRTWDGVAIVRRFLDILTDTAARAAAAS